MSCLFRYPQRLLATDLSKRLDRLFCHSSTIEYRDFARTLIDLRTRLLLLEVFFNNSCTGCFLEPSKVQSPKKTPCSNDGKSEVDRRTSEVHRSDQNEFMGKSDEKHTSFYLYRPFDFDERSLRPTTFVCISDPRLIATKPIVDRQNRSRYIP